MQLIGSQAHFFISITNKETNNISQTRVREKMECTKEKIEWSKSPFQWTKEKINREMV